MPTVESSIEIRGEQSAIFELTQDYDLRLSWDPFLKEAKLLNGATKVAVGVRAWCVSKNGLGMETEYIKVSPPDVVAVKMMRGPFLINSFAGSWRFRQIAEEITQVIFRYHFKANPAWLHYLLNPLMKSIFHRNTIKRLSALKSFVEDRKTPNKVKKINLIKTV